MTMVMERNKSATPHGTLTGRQERAVQLYCAGTTQVDAYVRAFKKQRLLPKSAREASCRLFAMPSVQARIQELRHNSGAKTVLTLNDRLAICAQKAQSPAVKTADQLRAVELYTKIAGGFAPERHEVTTPLGQPIQVVATVRLQTQPVRARIAALVAAKKSRDETVAG